MARSGGSSTSIPGATTRQTARSTISWEARPRRPSETWAAWRVKAKRARLRLAGGVISGGSMGTSLSPRRASAVRICSTTQRA
jgi:hypothetical protein